MRQPDSSGLLVHPELGTVVSGRLNHSALPLYQEKHDQDVDVDLIKSLY